MPNLPSSLTKAATTVVTALLAVLCGIALVLASTVPARAATTYTPTGGPSVTFVGTSISFTDIPAAQTFACTTFNLHGSVTSPGVSRAYGASAITFSTITAGGCSNPLCGSVSPTPSGTWGFAITGDPVSGVWPARLTNVRLQLGCGSSCVFTLTGAVNGKFNASTNRFTPNSGASGLVIASSPAPTGALCVTLDLQAGDDVAVGGYWTVTVPVGYPAFAVSNP